MYPAIPPRCGASDRFFRSCTREQGARFLRGELDYCPECCELVEPYEGEICGGCREQSQSPERLTGGSAQPAVNESRLIEAAAAARSLLSKLSSRLEIDEELHAEISRVEETLWGALFPGSQPPKRKWVFSDEGFESHVDLGDVQNELKRRL